MLQKVCPRKEFDRVTVLLLRFVQKSVSLILVYLAFFSPWRSIHKMLFQPRFTLATACLTFPPFPSLKNCGKYLALLISYSTFSKVIHLFVSHSLFEEQPVPSLICSSTLMQWPFSFLIFNASSIHITPTGGHMNKFWCTFKTKD